MGNPCRTRKRNLQRVLLSSNEFSCCIVGDFLFTGEPYEIPKGDIEKREGRLLDTGSSAGQGGQGADTCSAPAGTKVCARLIIRAKNTLSLLPWKKGQGKEMQENQLGSHGHCGTVERRPGCQGEMGDLEKATSKKFPVLRLNCSAALHIAKIIIIVYQEPIHQLMPQLPLEIRI